MIKVNQCLPRKSGHFVINTMIYHSKSAVVDITGNKNWEEEAIIKSNVTSGIRVISLEGEGANSYNLM